jgi:hypothetical protein
VRIALYHAKKSALQSAVRIRYGRGPFERRPAVDADFAADGGRDVVRSLAATGQAWFLTGVGDFATEPLRALEPQIDAAGSALEVAPVGLYPTPTPEAHDEVVTRTVAWARERVRLAEAPA